MVHTAIAYIKVNATLCYFRWNRHFAEFHGRKFVFSTIFYVQDSVKCSKIVVLRFGTPLQMSLYTIFNNFLSYEITWSSALKLVQMAFVYSVYAYERKSETFSVF